MSWRPKTGDWVRSRINGQSLFLVRDMTPFGSAETIERWLAESCWLAKDAMLKEYQVYLCEIEREETEEEDLDS